MVRAGQCLGSCHGSVFRSEPNKCLGDQVVLGTTCKASILKYFSGPRSSRMISFSPFKVLSEIFRNQAHDLLVETPLVYEALGFISGNTWSPKHC